MRIVSMCGSLGSGSANRAALDLAAEHLRSRGLTAHVADVQLAEVPMMNPDVVDEPPSSVAAMRSLIESADGVLLAAPEYAGGVGGGIKNALDWLVGSGSMYRRPVVVLSTGTTGGDFAIDQLVRTLSWHGAFVVDTLRIAAPRTKMSEGRFTEVTAVDAIERWADRLVDAISMSPDSVLARVAEVVTPFGIDPSRFSVEETR
jgi:chromate reductase, NAD(P)H dehydrogenase (quinone)